MKHQPIEEFAAIPRAADAAAAILSCHSRAVDPGFIYTTTKRAFDIIMCVLLAPVMGFTAIVLLVLNPFKNSGPLFYVQTRMGKDCVPFRAIKFRSMTCASVIERGANDPLETHRITKLGNFLRKSRLDEVPQIINVLKGDMSMVGPRPDFIDHATEYAETITGYKERHAVRPGISGYAQTVIGYVESTDGTRDKVAADLHYIQNRSLGLEAWIVWRTMQTVLHRGGA